MPNSPSDPNDVAANTSQTISRKTNLETEGISFRARPRRISLAEVASPQIWNFCPSKQSTFWQEENAFLYRALETNLCLYKSNISLYASCFVTFYKEAFSVAVFKRVLVKRTWLILVTTVQFRDGRYLSEKYQLISILCELLIQLIQQ